MEKHVVAAGAKIQIKEYKKSASKVQAVSTTKIQQIPFKPRPARLLDVLPAK